MPVRLSREAQGLALAVNLEVSTPKGIVRFEIDSGNGGTLLVSKEYAAQFGLDPAKDGPQAARIPLGGGIVADSACEAEYRESISKVSVLLGSLENL